MRPSVILLIEDSPEDAELTVRALSRGRLPHQVLHLSDGKQALDYLFGEGSAERPVPGLVMLDLKLPKVSGKDVLRRIKTEPRTRSLPVVVLTSSGEDRDVAECYSLGCNSYVRKPVGPWEFAEAVQDLCRYWVLRNELPPVA